MKKKLKLDQLEVQIVVTSLKEETAGQVKGAAGSLLECLIIRPNGMIGFSQGANICTRDSC